MRTTTLNAEEKGLALRAAKIMGLKVAGIDIIRSRKGPLLLEVDSCPSLSELEEISRKDLAGALITALERQLGWKRKQG